MELKTKPTQHSVKELLGLGIRPDVIVCRCEHPIDSHIREKIALFCNVPKKHVIENRDMPTLYEIPLALEKEGLAEIAIRQLHLKCGAPDLTDWVAWWSATAIWAGQWTLRWWASMWSCTIPTSLLLRRSSMEALKMMRRCASIGWTASGSRRKTWRRPFKASMEFWCPAALAHVGGWKNPGGKICAGAEVPYFGICLGLQIAIIEFARNVLRMEGASSTEFNPDTPYPVIDLMLDQKDVSDLGGTMRLGQYPCVLQEDSKAYAAYGRQLIFERHRHRYEVNNDYRDRLEKGGMRLCGVSPDKHIVEMIELVDHPWFLASQAHPEFKSRPNKPHPLFSGFIGAALGHRNMEK